MLQVFFFYSIALANKILKLMQKSEIESKSIKRHSSINLFAIKISDVCYSSFDMTREGNARGGNWQSGIQKHIVTLLSAEACKH